MYSEYINTYNIFAVKVTKLGSTDNVTNFLFHFVHCVVHNTKLCIHYSSNFHKLSIVMTKLTTEIRSY